MNICFLASPDIPGPTVQSLLARGSGCLDLGITCVLFQLQIIINTELLACTSTCFGAHDVSNLRCTNPAPWSWASRVYAAFHIGTLEHKYLRSEETAFQLSLPGARMHRKIDADRTLEV